MAIRVLLVDDNPAFLETAALFLSTDLQIQVVGSVRSGPEALEQVGPLHPHLVLMDLAMEGMNGLEATRRLKALKNPPQVVILTLYDNPEYRTAAEQARVDGFVAKSDLGEKLLPLIHHLFPDQTGTAASPASFLGQGLEREVSILGEEE